jgi:uncharacterized protein (TIGR02246 family)
MSTPISNQDVSAIKSIVADWVRTCLDADWEAFAALLTDDVVFMPPDAPAVEGKAAAKAFMESFPPIKEFVAPVIKVEGCHNFASARGTCDFTAEAESGELLRFKMSWFATYRKQPDGSWKCATDIWNSDEPPTAG